MHGTSLAAPVVTGLISSLLALKSNINNSEFRAPIVKAILSASAVSPKQDNLIYKSNGYEQKFGSGTVDFAAMLEASNNFSIIKIHPTEERNQVFTSKEINLSKNQTIKISSSWTFNAGYLKYKETSPSYWNYMQPFFKPINRTREESEWQNGHINDTRLKKDEALKRQSNKWFTNYDLLLERKNSNGDWTTVKRIATVLTNDELIEYMAEESGIYRYRVLKLSSDSFNNSVDDIVAVTHVVKNENY